MVGDHDEWSVVCGRDSGISRKRLQIRDDTGFVWYGIDRYL